MKKGTKYEIKAADTLKLEHPDGQVIHNAKVVGLLTGKKRQIDVKVDIQEYDFIAYECKDWRASIDIPVVEGFIQKLEDLGTTKGVMVSNSPFTDGAKKLAVKKGVKLLHVIDNKNPDIRIKIAAPTLVEVKNLQTYAIGINSNSSLEFPRIRDINSFKFIAQDSTHTPKSYLKVEWNKGFGKSSAYGENVITIPNSKVIGDDGKEYLVESITLTVNVGKDFWLGETGIEAAQGLYNVHTKEFHGFGNLTSEMLKISDIPNKFKKISVEDANKTDTTIVMKMIAGF